MAKTVAERPARENSPSDRPTDDSTRVGVYLTKDGAIDFSKMRDASRERFRAAIAKTPELVATLPPPTAQQADAALLPLCATVVVLLGSVAQSLAANRGFTNPEVLQFNQQEADQIGALGLTVLNKYGGSLKYAEEIALVAALGGHFFVRAQMLKRDAATSAPAAA